MLLQFEGHCERSEAIPYVKGRLLRQTTPRNDFFLRKETNCNSTRKRVVLKFGKVTDTLPIYPTKYFAIT